MRQGFFVLFLYVFSSFAYCQKQNSLLYHSYQSKSIKELHTFYENWASAITTMNDSSLERVNDTIRNIYHVFQSFYNPKDIGRLGGSEWGNDIYKNVQFLITQDRIIYGFVDTLNKEVLIQKVIYIIAKGNKNGIDTLLNQYGRDTAHFEAEYLEWPTPKIHDTLFGFYPQLSFSLVKALPLIPVYNRLLNQFLGDSHYNLGAGNIMAPARSKGESEKRMKFLENYIRIWYGHWGGYWQLYSYPYVSQIIFDPHFEHALIYFTMIYEGGYAYLKRINGAWTLIQAKRTWIE